MLEHPLGQQVLLHALRRVADLDALLGQERVGLARAEAIVGAVLLGEVARDQDAVDIGCAARQTLEQLAEASRRRQALAFRRDRDRRSGGGSDGSVSRASSWSSRSA